MRFILSIALCGVLLFCSCAREPGMRSRVSRVSDSLYMARAAMKVYSLKREYATTSNSSTSTKSGWRMPFDSSG